MKRVCSWLICCLAIGGTAWSEEIPSLEDVLNDLARPSREVRSGDRSLKLEKIMTEEELQDTGVKLLSPDQRAALEAWLTQWSVHFARTTAFLERKEEPARTHIPQRQLAPEALHLKELYSNVMRLRLTDGSVWEILPVEYQFAESWFPRDEIVVQKSRDSLYPYLLYNKGTGDKIKAQLLQATDSVEERSPTHAVYEVYAIQQEGKYIILDNQTSWEVAPGERGNVRRWVPGEKLQLEGSGMAMYPYRILNKKRGDQVAVRRKQQYEYESPASIYRNEDKEFEDSGMGFPRLWDYDN